jgi:hypothetical protein
MLRDKINAARSQAPQVKPKPPSVSTEQVKALCGHPVTLELLAKDPYRDRRREKLTERACPACRQKANAEREAKAEADREAKPQKPKGSPGGRLPDCSRIETIYYAETTTWEGSLTVPGAGVFLDQAGGINRLLQRLDQQYRDWLAEKATTEAAT